jgi:hypothetical protein
MCCNIRLRPQMNANLNRMLLRGGGSLQRVLSCHCHGHLVVFWLSMFGPPSGLLFPTMFEVQCRCKRIRTNSPPCSAATCPGVRRRPNPRECVQTQDHNRSTNTLRYRSHALRRNMLPSHKTRTSSRKRTTTQSPSGLTCEDRIRWLERSPDKGEQSPAPNHSLPS